MKVTICYPPLSSDKGVPLLSQNRQFQWFHRPTYIYPVVPACAATMAGQAGHEVTWLDGIAEQLSEDEFIKQMINASPQVALIEAKTPIIKSYWKWIDRLKKELPETRFVLVGDHVTALPEESFENSKVDFVLTGGDYDFLFISLLEHLRNGDQSASLPPGIYYRNNGRTENTGPFRLDRDLNDLPMIDRGLTRWQLYSEENGNFRRTPGTYTMAGRDCWWGKCAFCSWTTLYPKWRKRSPQKVLDEIEHIINNYPVREIFDDTGTFPTGQWLKDFCEGMKKRGLNKRVALGCNMIPGVLDQELYDLMAEANFRFVLFGLESAVQSTLDRIKKCGKSVDIENSMRMAKKAGLDPHVTCMVGYPWETKQQALSTIDLTRHLFDRGYIDTLQATIVIPYPGTPLFEECRKNGWLKTEDWDRYDMREPVMKTEMTDDEIMAMTRGIYRSFLSPRFVLRKLLRLRSWRDLAYYWKSAVRVLGHLLDFGKRPG